ncbi:hypothetical protein G5I_09623 [Acromyrmex echinatior]|uniref:Uncharacterized protein n=1 Tax=Acromyrmex echinatior TaxID=103372 RepID=F4WUP6_ACREC|nr:hypothetical protein G5I_09623 [Acromyrmex echinatior]
MPRRHHRHHRRRRRGRGGGGGNGGDDGDDDDDDDEADEADEATDRPSLRLDKLPRRACSAFSPFPPPAPPPRRRRRSPYDRNSILVSFSPPPGDPACTVRMRVRSFRWRTGNGVRNEKSLGSNTKPVGHSVSFGLIPLAAYRSSISRMRTDLVRTFMAILVAMSQQRSVRPHSIHVPDLDATPFHPVDLNRSESVYGAT